MTSIGPAPNPFQIPLKLFFDQVIVVKQLLFRYILLGYQGVVASW